MILNWLLQLYFPWFKVQGIVEYAEQRHRKYEKDKKNPNQNSRASNYNVRNEKSSAWD